MAEHAQHFARNLRSLRKKCDLTQENLADMLGYSKKTVSKWECGDCIPDIETLFRVSEILHTNLESLFLGGEKYLLGIDGGGTKTELMLTDAEGNVINRMVADTCNPADIGVDAAQNVLRDAIHHVCAGIPFGSVVMYAGIAGTTSTGLTGEFESFFESFGFRAFRMDSDNALIVSAGLEGRDGVTLILGTGICATTCIDGRQYRTAGWGYFIDNGGSAYNIGRDALNAYFTQLDRSGEITLISGEISKMFQEGPDALMAHIYSGGKKVIAGFASTVFRAFDRGDAVAERILRRNMKEAAHIIETASRELSGEVVEVVLAGGLTNEPNIIEVIRASMKNPAKFKIRRLDKKPIEGAIRLASELYGEVERNA